MSSTNFKETSSSHEDHLERARTAGGHIEDRSQPALPVIHRRLANPAPLGLLSFATGKMVEAEVSPRNIELMCVTQACSSSAALASMLAASRRPT